MIGGSKVKVFNIFDYQGILTEKEIRIAHNIQKLVLNGEFGIAKHVKLEKYVM